MLPLCFSKVCRPVIHCLSSYQSWPSAWPLKLYIPPLRTQAVQRISALCKCV